MTNGWNGVGRNEQEVGHTCVPCSTSVCCQRSSLKVKSEERGECHWTGSE